MRLLTPEPIGSRGIADNATVLTAGVAVLVASVVVERAATIRSRQPVDAAGGDWPGTSATTTRAARQGGFPPSRCSPVVGIVLIVADLL